ncbi:MAG: hypothetical protein WBF43_01410, partial [Methylocella sp.]
MKWTPPAGPLGPVCWLEVRPFLAPELIKLLSAAVAAAGMDATPRRRPGAASCPRLSRRAR